MKFNVIIPMAGESSRFNYTFKPFMYLDNRMFIEHVVSSFISYDKQIESYNFIVTKQQETDNNVTNTLKLCFRTISHKINVIVINSKTSGPYQTIISAIKYTGVLKNIIICDCDHSLDIEPIVNKLNEGINDKQVVIPLWNICRQEQDNWGKVILNESQNIERICEKEIVEELDKTVYGIIGCYYMNSTDLLDVNAKYNDMSTFLNLNRDNFEIDVVKITRAIFFGTPSMVTNSIEQLRKYETIICDVDGVLIQHKPHSNDDAIDNVLLGNCVEKLRIWKKENKKIILMTSRPETTSETFRELLTSLGIVYDNIVMGVNAGPRYLINDIKPSNIFVKQAVCFNLERDKGIDDIFCNETHNYNIEIMNVFKGNSFSKTYLVKNNHALFVRKYIRKSQQSYEHYIKLKRQCEDLKRFLCYKSDLVPKILNEQDDPLDYYIDMEYFESHKQLDMYDDNIKYDVLNRVIDSLESNVYCFRKKNTDDKHVIKFLNEKIYPKLNQFENECRIMNYLINSETVMINDKTYKGLRKVIEMIGIEKYNTEFLNPIHGDLTLENILYDGTTDDFKLIDMEGSQYVDSCYFDLGKIFQSILSNYKEWNCLHEVIFSVKYEDEKVVHINCQDKYFSCDNSYYIDICKKYANIMGKQHWSDVYYNGVFYMSMYFVRFVQFRRKISNEHGIFAIIMAVNWLNSMLSKNIS